MFQLNFESNVAASLLVAARDRPTRTALVYEGHRWTFSELARSVESTAARVSAIVRSGDRVAVIARNSDQAAIAILGTMLSGAVVVPLHAETPRLRLQQILSDSAPGLILADSRLMSTLQGCGVPHYGLESFLSELRPAASQACTCTSDDLAAIFYTSGSSGVPKGVMCRHGQMMFCVGGINAVINNGTDDVILSAIPLSFDYGFYQLLLAIASGARIVLKDRLPASILPTIVQDEKVTGLPLVPSQIGAFIHSGRLSGNCLESVRYVTSTGDVLPVSYIATLREVMPCAEIVPMYGLTECKRVSIMPFGALHGHERSVGLPLPGTSVRIVGANGAVVGPGEVGELRVRGPNLSQGYWRDAALTAKRFLIDPTTEERELCTGDLFRRDHEGFLYFVARSESVIKSCGERVGAGEVERVINEHPGVIESAAVGLSRGDTGEAVAVFVVVEGPGIDLGPLRARCSSSLPLAARPVEYFVSTELLPRSPHGKVQRQQLRQRAERESERIVSKEPMV